MRVRSTSSFLFVFLFTVLFTLSNLQAQVRDPKTDREYRKLEKKEAEARAFTRTDSLLNSRQFVFQADGSVETFVLVDSLFGEVQNGNRRNLRGNISKFEITRNEKRKQLSVSIIIRGVMKTADVVIFMDASGKGKATILSEFPGKFTIIGELVALDDAWIYEGPSHFVH